MKPHEQAVFQFGAWTLVPSERLLLRDGRPAAITGRAFDLLAALVGNAGHLLTKDELLATVWPGLVVEEVNLSVNVAALRKLLGADAGWIETVPRQGYRFNAAVAVGDVATLDLAQLRGLPGSYRGEGSSLAMPSAAPALSKRGAVKATAFVAIAAILALALYFALRGPQPYPSVAVLPWSVDVPASAPVADGLVEAVINGLTRVPDLRVVPRASAFRSRDTSPDPIEAGIRLQAAVVVTGALTHRGDSARLQVELVDVAKRAQVWSAVYDAQPAELAQIPGRVMHDLARAMRLRLDGAQNAALTRRASGNVEAYQAYLQGRYLWNQRGEANLQRAISHFNRAIELDPGFALAHAALADVHTALGYLGLVRPAAAFPVARPHALRALELDPSLAEAHAALAYIKFYFDWDWAGARAEFRRALDLNPNDPVSHQWYALYLLAAGHPQEAGREIETAHRLDPMSLAINTDVGLHHYYNGRYPEAVAQLRAVLAMKPDFLLAHFWLARTYLQMGRFDEAMAEVEPWKGREWSVLVAARGFAYGFVGKADEARAVLGEMETLSKRRFVTAYGVALVHAGLRRNDEAFEWLEKAFEERSHWLVWLRLDPRWNNIRGDPRFDALVTRMKYPA